MDLRDCDNFSNSSTQTMKVKECDDEVLEAKQFIELLQNQLRRSEEEKKFAEEEAKRMKDEIAHLKMKLISANQQLISKTYEEEDQAGCMRELERNVDLVGSLIDEEAEARRKVESEKERCELKKKKMEESHHDHDDEQKQMRSEHESTMTRLHQQHRSEIDHLIQDHRSEVRSLTEERDLLMKELEEMKRCRFNLRMRHQIRLTQYVVDRDLALEQLQQLQQTCGEMQRHRERFDDVIHEWRRAYEHLNAQHRRLVAQASEQWAEGERSRDLMLRYRERAEELQKQLETSGRGLLVMEGNPLSCHPPATNKKKRAPPAGTPWHLTGIPTPTNRRELETSSVGGDTSSTQDDDDDDDVMKREEYGRRLPVWRRENPDNHAYVKQVKWKLDHDYSMKMV